MSWQVVAAPDTAKSEPKSESNISLQTPDIKTKKKKKQQLKESLQEHIEDENHLEQ